MAERGITEAEAFRYLQRTAMNERTSMKALAEAVLAEAPAGETSTPG
jgi:response regulator NasT